MYAAPETDADLDNKQCNKCKSAKGTKSPFAALKLFKKKKVTINVLKINGNPQINAYWYHTSSYNITSLLIPFLFFYTWKSFISHLLSFSATKMYTN